MEAPTMPVKAIKRILGDELSDFYSEACEKLRYCISDVTKSLVHISHDILSDRLKDCETYEDLEEYISFAGYRMSLSEWIESL